MDSAASKSRPSAIDSESDRPIRDPWVRLEWAMIAVTIIALGISVGIFFDGFALPL